MNITAVDLVQHNILRISGSPSPVIPQADGSYLVDYFALAHLYKELTTQMEQHGRGVFSFGYSPLEKK
jgi:hypothetical protein